MTSVGSFILGYRNKADFLHLHSSKMGPIFISSALLNLKQNRKCKYLCKTFFQKLFVCFVLLADTPYQQMKIIRAIYTRRVKTYYGIWWLKKELFMVHAMVHFKLFIEIKLFCLSRQKAEIFSNCLIQDFVKTH